MHVNTHACTPTSEIPISDLQGLRPADVPPQHARGRQGQLLPEGQGQPPVDAPDEGREAEDGEEAREEEGEEEEEGEAGGVAAAEAAWWCWWWGWEGSVGTARVGLINTERPSIVLGVCAVVERYD